MAHEVAVDLIVLLGIALGLAMDAFSVAIGVSIALGGTSKRQTFRLAWHFGLFQALMPIVGWKAGLTVQEHIATLDHWVAFGLLVLIGGRMIVRAIRDGEEEVRSTEPTKGWSLVIAAISRP